MNTIPIKSIRLFPLLAAMTLALATIGHAAEKPLKVFILAGQSNMNGWGDSAKLSDDLRAGNDGALIRRVLHIFLIFPKPNFQLKVKSSWMTNM